MSVLYFSMHIETFGTYGITWINSFVLEWPFILQPGALSTFCSLHAHPSQSTLEYFILTLPTLTLFVRACAIQWRCIQPRDTRYTWFLTSSLDLHNDSQLFDFGLGHYVRIDIYYTARFCILCRRGMVCLDSLPFRCLCDEKSVGGEISPEQV